MKNNNKIYHDGTICSIDGNNLNILIETKSACSGCHAKAACGISSELKNKIITIQHTNNVNYKVGDSVTIEGSIRDGLYSVLMAYIIPSLLIILTLLIMYLLNINEIIAAFLSLFTITIYFCILYLLKHKIEKRIDFKITKTN